MTDADKLALTLDALRTIRGPADGWSPWMDAYREAGGGYEGLQAIAGLALQLVEV